MSRKRSPKAKISPAQWTFFGVVVAAIVTAIGTIIVTLIQISSGTSPAPTEAPALTITTTPTFTPTSIQNNSSKCNLDLAKQLFRYALSESGELAASLGSARNDPVSCEESSYQPFEGGEMIWRADHQDIYVLLATGEWEAYRNYHRDGEESACSTEVVLENQWLPELGFGKIWCENAGVKEELGYGTIGERYGYRAFMHFEGGWLILIDYTVRAILAEKQQWNSIDVFNFAQISLEARPDVDAKRSNLGLEQERFTYLPQDPLITLDPVTGKPLTVPFEVGWKVSTQCADKPQYLESIQIPTNISRPIRVYLLLQAGWGVRSYEYQTVGKVSLVFDNGESIETDLRLGFNIRDWADRPIAIKTLNSPYALPAWRGFDDSIPGEVDLLILDIPENHLSSILKQIQIEDTSLSSTGNLDPCIHLSGVTVSYLP